MNRDVSALPFAIFGYWLNVCDKASTYIHLKFWKNYDSFIFVYCWKTITKYNSFWSFKIFCVILHFASQLVFFANIPH
jgi:hypothetical protein